MPVKARRDKSRRTRLTLAESLSLTIGDPHPRDEQSWLFAFPSDEARRTAWEWHRDDLLRRYVGKRPQAWWDYDSPEPRDHGMNETLQLFRAGVLKGQELAAVMTGWAEWAQKAETLHWPRADQPPLPPGPEAAALWREWSGIPPELFNAG